MEDLDVVTGLDYALRDGCQTHIDWVKIKSRRLYLQGHLASAWDGSKKGNKVSARLDFERWIVDCPDVLCSGAEIVCLEDSIFFCMSCGNANNDFKAFPVKFPNQTDRAKIYSELDKRPLHRLPGQSRILSVESARPVFPGLGRSWDVGETATDLKKQREIYPNAYKLKTKKISQRTTPKKYPRNDAQRGGKI